MRLNTCENCGKYDWACKGACKNMEQPKMSRMVYINRFKTICEDMIELTTKKNNDYGGDEDAWKNFREFGKLGILVRMSDKWARIKTALFEKRDLQVVTETVIDTLRDLAVYTIILIIWIEHEQEQSSKTSTT